MVPQPVLAVLLLFPVTEDSEKVKDQGTAAFHSQWPAAMLCAACYMSEPSARYACCLLMVIELHRPMLPCLHSGRCSLP